MITKLELNCIASFERTATLETDKKVNLIYGLNGTGKSTLSNFLYDRACTEYSACSIEGLNDEIIIVYNKKFIYDYFYESDKLKGIFTLSKENKEAERKIREAQIEIEKLEKEISDNSIAFNKLSNDLKKKKQDAENIVWAIKTNFTGGDRILEYCLEGLKGNKDKLFQYIYSISPPLQRPDKTTEGLKKEVEALLGENAQRHSLVEAIKFTGYEVEPDNLLQKTIIGNENSTVAQLINNLNNSDWVRKGLEYLPQEDHETDTICPFCQEPTITRTFISSIRSYFDETYETDITALLRLQHDYKKALSEIPSKESYETNWFISESKKEFDLLYSKCIQIVTDNLMLIDRKVKTPSQKVALKSSHQAFTDLNNYIDSINKKVQAHNQKIDNKDDALRIIKDTFWNLMRWEYDQTLSHFKKETEVVKKKLSDLNNKIAELRNTVGDQKTIIVTQQKNTVNIDHAVSEINNGLSELGIDGFHIVKHSDRLYTIVRSNQDVNTFQTLSEGEKMIISFLYFRELCKGKVSATETDGKKIIVIDDPISSLSHIYIFNIGQMIKNDFFNSTAFSQVFVLTHSLYFFYELADIKHERRKENQKLFRMIKNCDGSQILDMKYDEIQNDYQSYWQVIKDEKQPPAIIANCMRNIVEYFFGFIEKRDLNNVFNKPELLDNKYQAFCRYINRESHSHGQNIFDYKEFNYNDFKDALGLVFKESGYGEHYNKMIK